MVFVSYAHEDRPFLEKDLLPFLRHLALGEHIELWEDSSIGAGQDWYAEIADRLDHAKVAILLVTENFLASKFCQHEEVPVLLQRARRGQLHVMPLLVEPSVWSIERWLKRRQMRPGGEKSLKEHTATKRKKLLTAFAKEVLAAVEGAAPPSVNEVHFDQPTATHDLHRLPETGSLLFGRRRELDVLDRAWDEGTTNIVAFTAGGGVGKSTLARVWAEMLAEDGWRGAERAFAWSFYSQGTGRMTDAETFLNEALHWFGEEGEDWEGRSMWDRADLLADHLRRNRTLLVLDGVEPLQSSEKIDRGSIRDPGLKTLLEELANGHPGLCIVTTRERLADLEETAAPGVLHRDLDQVSTLAGRALLRVKRIGGEDSQLEAAVHDLGGHALAVALLGNLVTDGVESPHISGNLVLPDLRHPVDQGGHPRRVLEAWARRLGESAEQELLQLLGLFDRPAPIAAVRAVIDGNPLPGLTKRLHRADLDEVFARLRSTGLLLRESKHDSVLDAHPIVRSHHGEWARTRHPKSVREANLRLYAYYCSSSRARPERLSEVVPLIAGIGHGCAAGKHQQTFVEVFIPRLLQDDQFLWHRLGAFAPALTTLAHYFHEPWQQPHSELGSQAQRSVLASAGYCLRALGKLAAAVAPTEAVIGRAVAEQDWQSA
ncbi:MAG: TIR domain-containing protein, partial [Planctomycetes bacterium]|nr:TIR domain-containing protein [Planctomycetota bacterium]